MMENEICETCKFWRRTDVTDLYDAEKGLVINDDDDNCWIGTCLRMPPIIDGLVLAGMNRLRRKRTGFTNSDMVNYNAYLASNWPVTCDADWCGEWQPNDKGTD